MAGSHSRQNGIEPQPPTADAALDVITPQGCGTFGIVSLYCNGFLRHPSIINLIFIYIQTLRN